MKHISPISTTVPVRADAIQFLICEASQAISNLLALKGATSPLADFIVLKCDFPEETGQGE